MLMLRLLRVALAKPEPRAVVLHEATSGSHLSNSLRVNQTKAGALRRSGSPGNAAVCASGVQSSHRLTTARLHVTCMDFGPGFFWAGLISSSLHEWRLKLEKKLSSRVMVSVEEGEDADHR